MRIKRVIKFIGDPNVIVVSEKKENLIQVAKHVGRFLVIKRKSVANCVDLKQWYHSN